MLPKGTASELCSPRFVFWAKSHFNLLKIAGNDIVICAKSKRPVCVYEAHIAVAHGGREKTYSEIIAQKTIKHLVASKPIISLGVMTRLQIDLIDIRTRPDKISSDINYCLILNCIDHSSKFSWTFPLKKKSAGEVVAKLRELFFIFGPPRRLHSDNGREFVSSVIMKLKSCFPDLLFIRGRPRHPQSQGCIERVNGILCDALGKCMSTNNSSSWSTALLPGIYGLDTRRSTVTKETPYEIMFGQRLISDSEFWKLVHEAGIDDEENLPTPVDEINNDMIDDTPDDEVNANQDIDNDAAELVVQLSEDAHSYSSERSPTKLTITSTASVSSSTAVTTPTTHDKIRKNTTDHYLVTANKKISERKKGVILNFLGF
ncbi:unnamed protein product [Rotaria socialis]|uniref:Integrase catalytic domain-containing protein n=4 Tax=Rotaria socialis TaxID=392032 RepID=A0A818YP70_9BILA|nr:unnamed protein product [Rotaria socialis]CAF4431408.1 unnamed protein product [Rotaria socialis]CAF4459142.1 unnamed protein product [Rotaria socialis]CAF4817664.1 unnamed protein product [Rotaria socialis]